MVNFLIFIRKVSFQRVTLESQKRMMSSQCLTLGWLCCIATEKIWWLLTKFIIK
ncbi:hypothetical protein [Wolbachia endosymbiont (group A) of Longitarsus flavicornis]|uniref:hypothetical protein n=1 Tax=Wolbachia endosymbiont (group A) of Longitarsus flavicornis TaxID=3066134 RepID=UPI0030CA1C11